MAQIQIDEEINGRYILKKSKGRGTFGEVWQAYDRATDEDVAIKFYVALDHKGREEFIQEYCIAAMLRHPNLLVTKDYGEWEGHPFLTMKYCNHGSAADLVGALTPGTDNERTIWRFIRDVAAGLAYLHDVRPDPIVHQDIKPDNILVDNDGTFLITDFGISKRIRNTMRKQSTRALKAGAPAYMGPERFSNTPEPILASDVWSLGVSIYEIAEGELPFCGMGGIMMSKGADVPLLSSGWSKNLNEVMHWCLEKETWDRAKASEVRDIAETVLNVSGNINVETLIMQMKEPNVKTDTGKGNGMSSSLGNSRATRSFAGGDAENINSEETSDVLPDTNSFVEPTSIPLWKKPFVCGLGIITLLVAVIAVYYYTKVPRVSTTGEDDTIEAQLTIQTDTESEPVEHKEQAVETASVADNVKTEETPPQEKTKVTSIVQNKNSSGTLDLGYAMWTGSIKSGKPDGKGTLTFTSSHQIDSRDPGRRIAAAGERVEGTFIKGHLDEGRWYKSDGTTEYILLGE